ncbi:MAG: glycosyltransferase [Cocleimonas sp.]
MKNKKNVLIIAYACEPNETSEPGVGWNFSQEISKFMNVSVLTRSNNKPKIEASETTSISFLYYDLPKIFLFLKKRLPLGTQLYFLLWQWGAYISVRKKIKSGDLKFNIIHQLTFSITWIAPPAFLFKLPFVWGPMGGGDYIPFVFLKGMKLKSIFQESIYYLINQSNKVSVFSIFSRKKCSALLFRTISSKDQFPKSGCSYRTIVSETAWSKAIPNELKTRENGYIHAVCIGRMTYWKGTMLAVKGFHDFINNGGNGKLELFGKGTELEPIQNYINSNNLKDKIVIRGFVSNDIVQKQLENADILLHPSFRDGGSWAVMEAMSYGLPVICLDTSGPKDMVTDQCGLLISMQSPQQVIKDITKALHQLAHDSKLYMQLSINAKQRIKTEYNWDKRGQQIKEVYNAVLGKL